MEFSFELATTKNAGRVFLFAASTAEDRRVWMSKLGKVFSCFFYLFWFVSDFAIYTLEDQYWRNLLQWFLVHMTIYHKFYMVRSVHV